MGSLQPARTDCTDGYGKDQVRQLPADHSPPIVRRGDRVAGGHRADQPRASSASRCGVTRILLVGAGLLLVCCSINLLGVAELNFWSALVLLGVGWNFLFVGATTRLTRTYDAREKAKVQALNDFLIFGTVALSSFSSGALLTGFGWRMVQLAVLPFVAIAAIAVLWLKLRAWRVPAPHYARL